MEPGVTGFRTPEFCRPPFRAKTFMLELEGLFRRLPGTTDRTEAVLLASIGELCRRSGVPPAEMLRDLQRTAQLCGARPNSKKGNRKGGGASDGEITQNISTWTEGVAFVTEELSQAKRQDNPFPSVPACASWSLVSALHPDRPIVGQT